MIHLPSFVRAASAALALPLLLAGAASGAASAGNGEQEARSQETETRESGNPSSGGQENETPENETPESEIDRLDRAFPALRRVEVALDAGDVETARAEMYGFVGSSIVPRLDEIEPDLVEYLLRRVDMLASRAQMARVVHHAREVRYLHGVEHLAPDDLFLMILARRFAMACRSVGDAARARDLLMGVRAVYLEQLPPDHPDFLIATSRLASAYKALYDYEAALELDLAVLAAWEKLGPPDNPELITAQSNLGETYFRLGDLRRARDLAESVHSAFVRIYPPEDPNVLLAKHNLGALRRNLSDFEGARELEEYVLEVRERTLVPDHPDLLGIKTNLAVTRGALGDDQGELDLLEEVHAVMERTWPADHPSAHTVRMNLAVARKSMHDLEGSLELDEMTLEIMGRTRPSESLEILALRNNLAGTLARLGEFERATTIQSEVLELQRTFLPPGDHTLVVSARNLAITSLDANDRTGAGAALGVLVDELRACGARVALDAPREARATARRLMGELEHALSVGAHLSESGDANFDRELFEAVESLRLAVTDGSRLARSGSTNPRVDELRAQIAAARERVSAVGQRPPQDVEGRKSWRNSLVALALERDALERALRDELGDAGGVFEAPNAERIAAALAPDAALVTTLRYLRRIPTEPGRHNSANSLLAFVVTPDGVVRRVELGVTHTIELLLDEWRTGLGRPLDGRAPGLESDGTEEVDRSPEVSAMLRNLVLDPIFAAAPDARVLHVVCDDLLHLVPLDALSLGHGKEDEGVVGDRYRVLGEVSVGRLLRAGTRSQGDGVVEAAGAREAPRTLLAVGGVAYGSAGDDGDGPATDVATTFAPLPATIGEARAVAASFEAAFEAAVETGDEQRVTALFGTDASKAAFLATAPTASFIHVATHGWFATELGQSPTDEIDDAATDRGRATLESFLPESLCGLAFAGANRSGEGGVEARLTAEEVGALDLARCELAVLSACETNVGIRRAGEGIQSLQSALHAAGVHASITSLWTVDDVATRRLFEVFYTRLWRDGASRADALWSAKSALRAEGRPVRDWAGWVLVGDPD